MEAGPFRTWLVRGLHAHELALECGEWHLREPLEDGVVEARGLREHVLGHVLLAYPCVVGVHLRLPALDAERAPPGADELLVVGLRCPALTQCEVPVGLVPEAARVRRQIFIAENKTTILVIAELELRVGDDDLAKRSVYPADLVDLPCEITELAAVLLVDRLRRDVLVVTHRDLGRRCEERIVELRPIHQTRRKRMAAQQVLRRRFLVGGESRAREITPDDALDRDHLELADDDRACVKVALVELGLREILVDLSACGDEIGQHTVGVQESLVPEDLERRQDFALVAHKIPEHEVEDRDAVARDNQHEVVVSRQFVAVADLTTIQQLEAGNLRTERCHVHHELPHYTVLMLHTLQLVHTTHW